MIWLALAALAAIVLAPVAWALRWRGGDPRRGRREAAVALHRAQLAELERDLAEERLPHAEHAQAMLEVQRRLLAADATPDPPEATPRAAGGVARRAGLALVLAPFMALGLYLAAGGAPGLPAAPLRGRMLKAEARAREMREMTDALKAHVATVDPNGEDARMGHRLLGDLEARQGDMAAAARDWGRALALRFDAQLALQTAEATTEAAGRVTPQAAALFRRALDAAPPDAPWRPMAERRLGEYAPR